jgi:hypothetical protein
VGTHSLTLNVIDSWSLAGSAFTTLDVMAAPTTVPEPAATGLLLIALAALAVVCRLRQWKGATSAGIQLETT